MNLETVLARVQEIEAAIVAGTNHLQSLYGHKTEALHWLGILQNPPAQEDATKVEVPVASSEEPPVE